MRNVFLENGYVSLNKYGEELCGDRVVMIDDEDHSTIVLSDGLGSGVKANILATLTAKIIATMMQENMPIEECVNTIAETLPVCNIRGIAYSTFSILQVSKLGDAYLVQFDNPQVIMLRGGKSIDYTTTQSIINGKKIYESKFKVYTGDMFILMSDGVIHAGVGKTLNFGWERVNVIEYAKKVFTKDISAKTMAVLLAEACNDLYMQKPGDDTTIAVLRVRLRQAVNLMIGPPTNKADDEKTMQLYFSKEGKRIVCGGTTSNLVSKFLDQPINTQIDYIDPTIPPMASIKGVDLVTEGVITIGKVLEIAQKYSATNDISILWKNKQDAASKICEMLFESATDINFFVGRAINPSHQNPDLPITIDIKLRLIEDLAICLEGMGKKVKINFY